MAEVSNQTNSNRPPIQRSYSLAENIFSGDGSLLGTFSGWGSERILVLSSTSTTTPSKSSTTSKLTVIADTSCPAVTMLDSDDGSSSVSDNEKRSGGGNQSLNEKKHIGLNVLQSVSIAGCDLLGSCLYTAGVCASNAGKVRKCTFLFYIYMLIDHSLPIYIS